MRSIAINMWDVFSEKVIKYDSTKTVIKTKESL